MIDGGLILINHQGAPLPATAVSEFERIRNVFSNGIGHYIADPFRNQPYLQ